MIRSSLLALGCLSGVCLAATAQAQIAQPITNFSNDVETAIDWGIAWMESNNFLSAAGNSCGQFSALGDGAGLAALAVLEKRRADPAQNALSQGWQFANATDQTRIANVMAFIISRPLGLPSANYRDGADLMALSLYQRTGGPDQAGALTALADRVDRVLANQSPTGYWDYGPPNPRLDSSATQLVIAGLSGARAVYQNPATSDPVRAAAISAALQLAGDAYATNGAGATVTPTERGHGYAAWVPMGPVPPGAFGNSLQQTSSGLWAMLAGGRTVNDPEPQGYVEWLQNHYRFTDLYQNGQNFTYSLRYYMWSATKAFRLIELQNNAAFGSLTPDALGTLVADPTAPANRQARLDPALMPRPASFANAANYTTFAPINPGVGGIGYYTDVNEPGRWYFDFAYTLLSHQDLNAASPVTFGQFYGNEAWSPCADQAWAILVLERALGGICTDLDADGICDEEDNCVQVANPDQTDANNNGIGDVCETCCELPGQSPTATSEATCVQSGGVPVADILCESVVCCATGADVAPYLIASDDCTAAGGHAIDETICCDDALCCRLPDGTAVDTNHADCVARQGEPVPDAVCAEPLCCHLPDGTYEVVPAAECSESNGALARRPGNFATGPAFPDLCAEMCCVLPDATAQTLIAGVCRDLGGVPAFSPDACDAPVCCGTADGAVSLTADACVEQQGVVLGADFCLEICCRGIGPVPAPASLWSCEQGGGIVVPAETCEPTVCCGLPEGAPQYLPGSDCAAQQGVVLAADRCDSACCVTGGQPSVTSTAACAAQGGTVDATGAACAVAICCALPDGQPSTLPLTECLAAGGSVTAAEKCVDAEVCCALPDGTASTMLTSACTTAMGQPTAAEKCDDAPGCCKLPDGTTDDLSADACKEANGTYIPDVECVPDVCCKRKDGTIAFVDPALCKGPGQAVVSDEMCEQKICCRVDGHVEWLAADQCDEANGQNVESAACVDVICCEVETGVFQELSAGECADRPVAHPKRCNVPVEIDGGLVGNDKDAGVGNGGGGNGGASGGGCTAAAPVAPGAPARLLALAVLGLGLARRRRRQG